MRQKVSCLYMVKVVHSISPLRSGMQMRDFL